MPFYKDTPENRRLERQGVGYGKDIGKTDSSIVQYSTGKAIKKPKEKVESFIPKKGITKKGISNLKDFDKQKAKVVRNDEFYLQLAEEKRGGILFKIRQHNEYEEELLEELKLTTDDLDELEDRLDNEFARGKKGKVKNEEGQTTKEERDNLLEIYEDQREELDHWDQESYVWDKKLKKIESDIENLSKLVEGKINRQKDNELLNKVIKKEKNEIKKLEKELEQLFNKSKNKKLNVGKLNTILNEIQYINRAIERKSKIFKLAKPRPIGSVAQPTIKSATASIKFNETVEDPRLIKALKRLEVLKNKPKSIIVSTLIREQQFIIRRFREAMRIRGLMIKLK